MSKLVLFCNDYPNDTGDAAFIRNEIDELAGAFDEVVIFTMKPMASTQLPMPASVRAVHSLTASKGAWLRQFATAPRCIAGLKVIWQNERGRVKTLRQLIAVGRAIVVGRVIAGDPTVQRELNGHDVVTYFYWGQGSSFALPWLRPSVSGARRIVIRMHRFDLYDEVGYQALQRAVLGAADNLLFISRHGLQYLSAKYPEFDAKMNLSFLGTKDKGVGNQSSPEIPTFVSCSNLIPVKRVGIIAAAMCEVAKQQPIKWVHFGDGSNRADVEQVLASAPSGLEFQLAGAQPNDVVLEYLKSQPITAFVNSSLSEGIPVSLMEALSFDIPIVAPNVGGVNEMFPEGNPPGILSPAQQSATNLATDLQSMIDHRVTRGVPRSVWQKHFNAAANAAATARILKGRDAP